MITGLVRALALTCYGQAARGEARPVSQEILRAAKWRAAPTGSTRVGRRRRPARGPRREVVESLSLSCAPLEEFGSGTSLRARPRKVARGNGAAPSARLERRGASRTSSI